MEAINIPISFCAHTSAGKIRGWYVLAKRLFAVDTPILSKHQFIGFNGCLLVSVVHPNVKSIFELITKYSKLEDFEVKWFGQTSLWPLSGGFKIYIPEKILKIPIPERFETRGVFRRHDTYRGEPFFYLEIPAITTDILLGHKELK